MAGGLNPGLVPLGDENTADHQLIGVAQIFFQYIPLIANLPLILDKGHGISFEQGFRLILIRENRGSRGDAGS